MSVGLPVSVVTMKKQDGLSISFPIIMDLIDLKEWCQ